MSFDFIFSIRATLSMSSQEKLLQDLAYLISGVVVLPLWTWLAVSTQQCLRVITSRTIPFSRRKIWLVKVFALVIPAGGVFGLASDLGAPLYFALFPALVIVIFGFREKVQGVIPPKPPQGEADYQIAWKEYRRLRKATMLSWMWSLGTFLLLILIPMVSVTLPKTAQIAFLTVSVLALIGSMGMISFNQLKFLRWPCPRCGCSFRGFWGTPWMPKACGYCGLPRKEDINGHTSAGS
jgi:hypothetical protein